MTDFQNFMSDFFTKHGSALRFRNESDREIVINALSKRYDVFGSSIVMRKNGQRIDPDDFFQTVYAASKPHLSTMSLGNYVSKYWDGRTDKDKQDQQAAMCEMLDKYFDGNGIVFLYEHLGDLTFKELVKNRIAASFLFEGDPSRENRLQLRRHWQALFSRPMDLDKVVMHYSSGYIDSARTTAKQQEFERQTEDELLKRWSVGSRKEINMRKLDFFNEQLAELREQKKTLYSNKRLPAQSEDEVLGEFRRRSMFKQGLIDESGATTRQLSVLSVEANEALNELNSLPNLSSVVINDLKTHQLPAEPWQFETLNKQGHQVPPEMLTQ